MLGEKNVSLEEKLLSAHQFLEEAGLTRTVRQLEQETRIFFSMSYFEDMVTKGIWDEVENYLSAFTLPIDNSYSKKIFFEIRKQKCLEDLCRDDKLLLNYGDRESTRRTMLADLKKLIEENPKLCDKLKFSKATRSMALMKLSNLPGVDRQLRQPYDKNDVYLDLGELVVFTKLIGSGRNGKVVREGIYNGHPVAIKCLANSHHSVDPKEIQFLMDLGTHENIVRYYGMKSNLEYTYIALERCSFTLKHLIKSSKGAVGNGEVLTLWKDNNYPSPLLLRIMRDIVRGVSYLHKNNIIHGDLKPQNVLFTKDSPMSAKISDMCIRKCFVTTDDDIFWDSQCWQAPELISGTKRRSVALDLLHEHISSIERHSIDMDLFSLGCVLFYCMTRGRHPFEDSIFEPNVRVCTGNPYLRYQIVDNPEANDLISGLLDRRSNLRLGIPEVLKHPMLWDYRTRLSFLQDVDDLLKSELRYELLAKIESIRKTVFDEKKWTLKIHDDFVMDIQTEFQHYNFGRVRDLIRVISYKSDHFDELRQCIKEIVGMTLEEFEEYFSKKFPRLIFEVYNVLRGQCKKGDFPWVHGKRGFFCQKYFD